MKLIRILVFLLIGITASAQEELPDFKRHEVGIGFSFINNFLPLDNDIGRTSPYRVYYNSYKSENVFTRHAFNLNLVFRSQDEETRDDIEKLNFVDIDYKIGIGKEHEVYRGFEIAYGWDILLDFLYSDLSLEQVDNNITTTNTQKQFGLGVGPFVGLRYNITDRVSLFTEASYYLLFDYTSESIEIDPGTEDSKDKTIRAFSSFSSPRYLVLFYKF